jgi:hypothetical protein
MRKLPVWQTFSNAIGFVAGNYFTLLRLTWLPFLALFAVTLFVTPYFAEEILRNVGTDRHDPTMILRNIDKFLFIQLAIGLLQAIVVAAVAVAIHRVILFGDRREGQYFSFAFGWTELLYVTMGALSLLGALALMAVVFAPVIALIARGDFAGFFAQFKDFPANVIAMVKSGAIGPLLFAYVVGWIALVYFFLRLSVWPPAVVATRRLALFQAWRLTEGNALRMLGLFALAIVALYVIALPFAIAAGAFMFTHREALDAMRDGGGPMEMQRMMRDVVGPYLPILVLVQLLVYTAVTGMMVALVSFAYKALNGVAANEPLPAA